MRVPPFRSILSLLLGAACAAQSVQAPPVVDRTLANGIRVLIVERPGTGVVRAGIFVLGGRAATGGLPPAAADLLAQSLFRRVLPRAAQQELEPALRSEEASFEALRLDRLRQERRPDREPSAELPALQAMHREALAAIQSKVAPVDAWDDLDALGGTRRVLEVGADYLSAALDLPTDQLAAWAQLAAQDLAAPRLGRFPLERERLLQELDRGQAPCAPSTSVLLSMALSGGVYAQAEEFQRAEVEALTSSDLAGLAGQLLVPGRLALVFVGDADHETLLPVLERSFAKLGQGAARTEARFQDDQPVSALESPAGRRMFVSTTGETRVIFGWRIPPANHPDGPAIRVLAQILAGGPSARLNQGLVDGRGLARTLTLATGVPGERDMNLLVINAQPAEGHALAELEQAIEGEVLRLQNEPLPEAEVRRAQVQLESQEIQMQDDAGVLARALGLAHCQGGDWRLAFRSLNAAQQLRPSEIQAAARAYLVPPRMTVAQFAPDPLLLPMDRTEGRLLQALTVLVTRRVSDPVAAQGVLREALRQLRMLSAAERQQMLKLLEAQVPR